MLVTSALEGEGKTETAASLARVFALGGYRTIVVDADLRDASMHEALNVMRRPGLADLLMSRAAFHHVIRKDSMSPAHVMQAGTPIANPTAALASSQMLWVLNALQQTYDYVIIDSPAALSAADAQVLAKAADVTVLVTDTGTHRTASILGSAVALCASGALNATAPCVPTAPPAPTAPGARSVLPRPSRHRRHPRPGRL